jgi:hypothetical protein
MKRHVARVAVGVPMLGAGPALGAAGIAAGNLPSSNAARVAGSRRVGRLRQLTG